MKRVTALSILLALCLTLSGCGGSTSNDEEAPPTDSAGETTTEAVSDGPIPILEEKTAAPFSIGPERIGLPTGGAEIDSVMFVKDGEGTLPTGDFYRVNGRIRPVDPDAPDILFEAGLPVEWNGKLVQYGGGGLDGTAYPVDMVPFVGRGYSSATPIQSGYAVFDCDGGHAADPLNTYESAWALNDEALRNYAHEAQKKTRDTVYAIVTELYGAEPTKIYYGGSSNGGREAVKTLELYPDDYDGAVILYPVLYYTQKLLKDYQICNLEAALGENSWISQELYAQVQQAVLDANGVLDGMVDDLSSALANRDDTRQALQDVLNAEQFQILDFASESLTLPFPLAYDADSETSVTLPGYAPYEGAPMIDFIYNNLGTSTEGEIVNGSADVIRYLILRDADADVNDVKPDEIREQIQTASALLDAYGADLKAFQEKGGKVILLQGDADQMVTPYGTVQYYNRLKEVYGQETLDSFLKFYMVPGYGHGMGEMFWMDADLLSALDEWVCDGAEPDGLTAYDINQGRARPLCKYPDYPAYDGQGDIQDAASFAPEAMDTEILEKTYLP